MSAAGSLERSILATVGRRPQTAADIGLALGRHRDEVLKALTSLLRRGAVRTLAHGDETYFAKRPA